MRKFIALTLAICMMLSCAITAAQAETAITFSWWGGDSRHEATQKAVEAFMAANPDITVTNDYGAWSGWEDKVSTALYAGTASDLNQTNWNWLSNYDNGGKTYVDLNEYKDVIDLTQFDQALLDQCTIDGRLVGIPISVTGRIFYWNADTYAKAGLELPTSFADLMAAGEVFKTQLGEDYYPLTMGEYDRMIFVVYYLESKYGKAWIEDGVLQYDAAQIAEALQVLLDMEAAHVIPSIKTILGDGAESLDKNPKWSDGRYAGILEWDSSASKFQKALANPDALKVGTYFADLGEYQGGFTKISMCFAISASAKDPAACAKLLNYLLNEEEGVKILASQRGIPASKVGFEICQSNDLLDTTVAEANTKVVEWCQFALDPYFEDAGLKADPDGLYYDVHSGISYGDYTVEEAAEMLIEGINDVIGK